MKTITIKCKAGRSYPRPGTRDRTQNVGDQPTEVEDSFYWRRAIAQGDVVLCEREKTE